VPEEPGILCSKAANAVRVRLASQMGLQRLYELDRLDLSVQSTLDGELQKKTTDILRQLKNRYARAADSMAIACWAKRIRAKSFTASRFLS